MYKEETVTTDLTVWGLDESVINQIIEYADNQDNWAKLRDSGFKINGKIYSRVAGYVIGAKPKWVKWFDSATKKKFDKPETIYRTDPPDREDALDFTERCDIRIKTTDGNIVNIDLAPSSYRNFSVKVREIMQGGKKLDEIILGAWVDEAKSKDGNMFPVIVFEYLDESGNVIPEPPWVGQITSEDDDIKY
jgi:hypothetical protein